MLIFAGAFLKLPTGHEKTIHSNIAHAYLKLALQRVEECRQAMQTVMITLPSHADQQLLLLQIKQPDTLTQFDHASEARILLRLSWVAMTNRIVQAIESQRLTFQQTLSFLERGRESAIQIYKKCKRHRASLDDSTDIERNAALENFDFDFNIKSRLDRVAKNESVMVAYSTIRYWQTLENFRESLKLLVHETKFDAWLMAVASLRVTSSPIRDAEKGIRK